MAFLRNKSWALALSCAMWMAACGDDTSGTAGAGGVGGSAGTGGSGPAIDLPDRLTGSMVGHTRFTLTDASRDDREIPVDVWYPSDEQDVSSATPASYELAAGFMLQSEVAFDDLDVAAGAHALLIFSHGFGGINTQSTQLMEVLASHGFIVASPSHTGNTALDMSDPTPAASRVPDVTFVIDDMFARSNMQGSPFEGRVDESRVGALGHSFGGSTALGSVAGWAGAAADPRVGAIGIIAGGVGSNNFPEEVLMPVTVPTVMLVGTLDPGALANHEYVFDNMPNADPLFKIEVTDANHTHFANVCDIGDLLLSLDIQQDAWPGLGAGALIDPYNSTCTEDVFPIGEAQRLQNLYMVAHFRRYLLDETVYGDFLTADYAASNEPAVSFAAK